MAESVNVTNMPDSGSRARVAFDMLKHFSTFVPENLRGEQRLQWYFTLYEDCYNATGGSRITRPRP